MYAMVAIEKLSEGAKWKASFLLSHWRRVRKKKKKKNPLQQVANGGGDLKGQV